MGKAITKVVLVFLIELVLLSIPDSVILLKQPIILGPKFVEDRAGRSTKTGSYFLGRLRASEQLTNGRKQV